MPWHPAITAFLLLDLALLVAIAFATPLRRSIVVARRRRERRLRMRAAVALTVPSWAADLNAASGAVPPPLVSAMLWQAGRDANEHCGVLAELSAKLEVAPPRTRLIAAWAVARIISRCPHVATDRSAGSSANELAQVRALMLTSGAGTAAATEHLRQALAAENPAVRRAALRAVECTDSSTALMDDLERRVHDRHPDIRLTAARLIGRAATDRDLSRLLRLLVATDAGMQQTLLTAMSRADQPLAVKAIAAAEDPSSADRLSAIAIVGTGSDGRARQAIATLLRDRDPGVRSAAAVAAGRTLRIGWPMKGSALAAADAPRDRLVDQLLRLVAEESIAAVLHPVVQALACSGDDRAPAALLGRISSASPALRERLIEGSALIAQLAAPVARVAVSTLVAP